MRNLSLVISFLFSSLALYSQTAIGTTEVDQSAILELNSATKGFLPTRVQLQSVTDKVTILSPATGLVVYHSGITGMDAGLYVNVGTPANASWVKGGQTLVDESQGTRTYKIKYLGRNIDNNGNSSKPTLKINELNLEFRFAVIGASNYLQIRLITPPAQTVNIKAAGHWQGQSHNSSTHTFTFRQANFNVWQNIEDSWNGWWSYLYYFTTDELVNSNMTCTLYGICSYRNQAGNINNEQYLLAGEVF